MKRIVAGIAGASLATIAAGVWWYSTTISGVGHVPPAEQVQRGAQIYAENCASCHGARGQGHKNWRERKPDGRLPAPPLNGNGHTWHHSDSHLRAVITKGVEAMAPEGYRSDMPPFGDTLNDGEIRDILAYIKTWWPEDALARQQGITERSDAAR